MATILKTKSIYYNDVNLIAQPSIIHSRSEVPKELNRIIVSPMESLIGETFAKEANNLGLTICLHRFCPVETQISIFLPAPPGLFAILKISFVGMVLKSCVVVLVEIHLVYPSLKKDSAILPPH